MQKYKFVCTHFDPEKNITYVTIATPLGHFTGSAKLHEGDKPRYVGNQIAEIRAYMRFLRAKRARLRLQEMTIYSLFEQMFGQEGCNPISVHFVKDYGLNFTAAVDSIDEELEECDDLIITLLKQYQQAEQALKNHMARAGAQTIVSEK